MLRSSSIVVLVGFVSGSDPVRVWVRGSCLGTRVCVWFVSGSCLVRVWVSFWVRVWARSRLVSGLHLFRVRLVSGLGFGSCPGWYLVRVWVRVPDRICARI